MKPKSNMELGNKFVTMIRHAKSQEEKQAIYNSAYAYAVIAGRDFVKFQPIFFMTFIENNTNFIPEVRYGFQQGDKSYL